MHSSFFQTVEILRASSSDALRMTPFPIAGLLQFLNEAANH
jgi:hypothetical protein